MHVQAPLTFLRAADERDVVSAMMLEEFETFHDPRIETAARMPGDLSRDVISRHQPAQLGLRGRRPHGLFAFFAVISESHGHELPVPARSTLVDRHVPCK